METPPHQTPKDNKDNATREKMEKRVKNLFTEQEPPSFASLREVEAMKARISELEAQLASQTVEVVAPSALITETSDQVGTQEITQTLVPSNAQPLTKPVIPVVKEQAPTGFWRRLLHAPAFGDHVMDRVANLQYKILAGLFISIPLGVITLLLSWNGTPSFYGLVVLVFEVLLFSRAAIWLYSGHLDRVSWVLVGTLYVVFAGTLSLTGFSFASALELALVIALAGVLLRPIYVVIVSTIVVLTLPVFSYLSASSQIPQNQIVFVMGILGLEGLLLTLASSALEKSFAETGQSAQALTDANRDLQTLAANLETYATERTHDLELATDVGYAVSQKIGDLTEVLSQAVELIRSRYDLYYTQIYLLDSSGYNLVLHAATGDIGKQLLARGHRLSISASSLNVRAVSSKKPVLVGDTKQSDSFLPNPLLPLTRSELAVPIIAGNKVVGVLDMQGNKPEIFSEVNVPAFQVLATQIAIAIQNSALFQQTEEARLEVEEQTRRLTSFGWREFLNAVERNETIGYTFDQKNTMPMAETPDAIFDKAFTIPIEVAGAHIGEVQLADETTRKWTETEQEVVQAAMLRVAQHIETLRLLAQAESYRHEAEQVSRRLTSEGWGEYFRTRTEVASGYNYNQHQVRPLNGNGHYDASASALTYPLTVRDEPIGIMMVDSQNGAESYDAELIAAVAEQLSDHIENLRLFEQTQAALQEAKEAEKIVRTSEAKLTEALEIAKLANWEYDVEKDIFTFNDQFYSIFHTTAEKMGGYQLPSAVYAQRLVHPDDVPIVGAAIEKALASTDKHYSAQLEHRVVYTEGGVGYISVEIHIERDDQGKIIRYYGANQDITERKLIEQVVAKRAIELQTVAEVSTTTAKTLEPDRLLQAVVNLSKSQFNLYHAHIYLMDKDEGVLVLAAGSGEIGKQMVASGWNILLNHEQSIVAKAARDKKSVVANDVVHDKDSAFLSNRLLPDTRSEIAVPMIVGEKVLGVFDVQSDIANYFSQEDVNIFTTLASQVAVALQNARLYEEQAATVTQLRELDRLKSAFLANMSHELRTPLNSILGFTDVMLEGIDGDLTDYMDNDLRLIQKNGRHLLHLINDVLDMARIESGRMNLHPETFKVHDLLEEVNSITSPLASEKNLALFIDDASDHLVEIYADNTRLRQVMINLVNNSIKFTEKGKISLSVKPMDSARILITVKDTGIGIPPDHLEAVFQEFTQVDTTTTRKAGGTGLGLPISRRLVEMHGGRLWADSTGIDGEGSTFFVELPVEAQIADVIEKQEK